MIFLIQSYDFLKLAYDAKFCYITTSGLMFVASMKTYKLKLLHILKKTADFQKPFLFYRYISTFCKNAS